MKNSLIERTLEVLHEAGFAVSEICSYRSRSFDLAARRDELLILLKLLSNIDGINREIAEEMKRIAAYLSGSPVIVGERVGFRPLERGVVYYRYDIPSVSVETLYDYLVEDSPPLVYSSPGGFYVSIDGEALRRRRLEEGLSLGDIASYLGTSRRTISKYEEGMDATIDNALKLEELLGAVLIKSIDFLNIRKPVEIDENIEAKLNEIEKLVIERLKNLGFDVLPTLHSPFDTISKDELSTLLVTVHRRIEALKRRARLLRSLSEIACAHSVFILDSSCSVPKNIEGNPVVNREELEDFDDSKELIEVIYERSEN
ncbi:MAG: putative transcriptional regulator [Archaeoglobi archaeon]|nr:transcriptional regulator [Candidatus Mnemosynella bozhongmuii]MDK2781900.1 putative transcriptional regulator [Archaeoglobi archaeon]